MADPIDAVVFDLGGVLIDWNPRYLYRRLFDGDEAGMERFLAEICTAEWNAEQDAGRPWHEAVDSLAARHPDLRPLIAAYDERWPETLGGAIEGSVRIVEELAAAGSSRLIALTNWSAEKFPIARSRYPFLGLFEGIVVSGELGMLKPDPRIFGHLFDRFALVPRRTAFVDDSAANVEAAAGFGMVAIRFEEPSQLRRALGRLGLLKAEVA